MQNLHSLGLCMYALSWLTLCNPMTIAHQAPLSVGFPKQEYWGGWPFLSPGDLSDLAAALAGRFFTTEPPGKPRKH